MKVKIKRATTKGLKKSEGEFFEAKGRQFCLIYADEDDLYFCIELSTGCSVQSFNPIDYSRMEAIRVSKNVIESRTDKEWENALIVVAEKYCTPYGFKLPVNKPIKLNK